MNKTNSDFESSAIKSVVVDFIFTFLPLIVLILIRFMTCKYENIFLRSDFSYISMILFGQTIIKFFSGISENENKKRTYELVLHLSLIISLGLIPSTVILVLLEVGYKVKILFVAQGVWLVVSVLTYLFFGVVGNMLMSKKIVRESDIESMEKKHNGHHGGE